MILEELLYLLISFLFRNRSRTESNKNDFFNEFQMISMDDGYGLYYFNKSNHSSGWVALDTDVMLHQSAHSQSHLTL